MEPIPCQQLPFTRKRREAQEADEEQFDQEAEQAEASPAEGVPPQNNFLLLYDPGPYPLGSRMELCLWEVRCGLESASFHPGTLLYDKKSGLTHKVCRQSGRYYLKPHCARLKRRT
jgi:hypothetical protein